MAELTRLEALRLIERAFPKDPIVLALGTVVREMLLVTGVKENHLHVLDSMGLPPAIGLGLAIGLEGSRVDKLVVVEGDGGVLMGFTTLTTIGRLKPKKLLLIVLDNGTYAATGDQPSGAEATDLAAVARGCGFDGRDIQDGAALEQALAEAKRSDGPLLLRVRISRENAKAGYFLPDPPVLLSGFQRYLEQQTS